jgi:hypothetical protein
MRKIKVKETARPSRATPASPKEPSAGFARFGRRIKLSEPKTRKVSQEIVGKALGAEGATCHLVKIEALVFGWKDKSVLRREIVDGIEGIFAHDFDDLEISIVGDDEPEFPHAPMPSKPMAGHPGRR